MKKFIVRVPVTHVDGHQTYSIDAESEDDAVAKVRAGEGEFYSEHLEVMSLDFESADDAEELEDES